MVVPLYATKQNVMVPHLRYGHTSVVSRSSPIMVMVSFMDDYHVMGVDNTTMLGRGSW